MSHDEGPREADFEKTSEKLNEGLKTCRTVLEQYRGILVGDQHDEGVPDKPATDEPGS